MPLDVWRRVWSAIARPPVIEAEREAPTAPEGEA